MLVFVDCVFVVYFGEVSVIFEWIVDVCMVLLLLFFVFDLIVLVMMVVV